MKVIPFNNVYFAHTAEEAEWVRANCKVRLIPHTIIATSLAAQYTFFSHGMEASDGFRFVTPRLYTTIQKSLIHASHWWCLKMKQEYQKFTVSGVPIFDLLQTPLEAAYVSILFSDYLLQKILQHIPDAHFFVSQAAEWQLGRWDPKQSTSAAYIKTVLPKERFSVYHIKKPFSFSKLQFPISQISHIPSVTLARFRKIFPISLDSRLRGAYEFLFFSSGDAILHQKEVITALLKKHTGLIVAGNLSPVQQERLREARIPFSDFSSFQDAKLDIAVNKNTARVIQSINNLKTSRQEDKLTQVLNTVTKQVIQSKLKQIIKQTLLAKKIIHLSQAKLVITTHDPGISSLPFVLMAKQQAKKTLVLLHGWNDSTLGANHQSEHAAVWGRNVAHWFTTTLKKPEYSIHAVGFPLLEQSALRISRNKTVKKARKKKLRVGLLLTQYPFDTIGGFSFFTEIFLAAKLENFQGQFLLRPRSDQQISAIYKLASFLKINYTISNETLEECIDNSDVVITWDTTAMFWVMLMGKPLMYTTPLWGEGYLPVSEFKAGWIPRNARYVFEIMRRELQSKKSLLEQRRGQRRMLKEVIGMQKIPAAVRTEKLITKLINKS